jgi:hypothetical protein
MLKYSLWVVLFGFLGLESPVHLVILTVIAVLFVFWIWMLVDCLKNPRLHGTEKLIWVLVIIFLHWIGALVYYFVGRANPA